MVELMVSVSLIVSGSLRRIELLHRSLESRMVAYRVQGRVCPVQKKPEKAPVRLFDDLFYRLFGFAEFRQAASHQHRPRKPLRGADPATDRKSTRLNSSH